MNTSLMTVSNNTRTIIRLALTPSDRGPNKDTEILSNVCNIEREQVGQNQEEDADRRQFDQEFDDDEDDSIDFFDGAQQRGLRFGSFDQATDDDCADEHCQELVLGECLEDVLWDKGLRDLDHDVVRCVT